MSKKSYGDLSRKTNLTFKDLFMFNCDEENLKGKRKNVMTNYIDTTHKHLLVENLNRIYRG